MCVTVSSTSSFQSNGLFLWYAVTPVNAYVLYIIFRKCIILYSILKFRDLVLIVLKWWLSDFYKLKLYYIFVALQLGKMCSQSFKKKSMWLSLTIITHQHNHWIQQLLCLNIWIQTHSLNGAVRPWPGAVECWQAVTFLSKQQLIVVKQMAPITVIELLLLQCSYLIYLGIPPENWSFARPFSG